MSKVKKEKPFRKKYLPVVVYFDALEELYYTIKETCQSVEISSADYNFESLQSAKEYFGSRPQVDISISGSKPYVSLDFDAASTTLHITDDEKAAKLFYELDSILSAQQRAAKHLYGNWVWIPVMLASSGLTIASQILPPTIGYIYAAIVALSFFWVVWAVYVDLKRHSVVMFERRSEAKTFLETNRNAIVMSIITSIISGAIGYGFAKLKDPPATPAVQVQQKQCDH